MDSKALSERKFRPMTEGSDQKGADPDTEPSRRLIDRLPTREVVDPADMLDLFLNWVHEQGLGLTPHRRRPYSN